MNRWRAHLKELNDRIIRLTRENEQLTHSTEFYRGAYHRQRDSYDRLLTYSTQADVKAHLDAEGYKSAT